MDYLLNPNSYMKYNHEEKSSEDNSFSGFNKEVNGFQFATIKTKKNDLPPTQKPQTQTNNDTSPKLTKSLKKSSLKNPIIQPLINNNNGWDPTNSIDIPQINNHKEMSKEGTFGSETENSYALDYTGNKVGASFKNTLASKKIEKNEILNEKKESTWQPEESLVVDSFGANLKNTSTNKKLEKKPTTGWNPQESVAIDSYGAVTNNLKSRISTEGGSGFPVMDSIQIGNNMKEIPKNEGFPVVNSIQRTNKNEQKGFPPMESIQINNVGETKKDNEKEFPAIESVQILVKKKENKEETEKQALNGGWGIMESVDVGANQNKKPLINKKNPQEKVEVLDIIDSVPVQNKINSQILNSNYTLPETFFSKRTLNMKNHNFDGKAEESNKIFLLTEALNINYDSFKLLYNKDTVVRMVKLQEDVKMKIKMPSMNYPNVTTKKLIPNHKGRLEEKGQKGEKGGKISKIIKINNRICIVIHDIKENLSKTVTLKNLNVMPSKYHCWDQYLGYFYIYDNLGKISVYIGNIKDNWSDDMKDSSRKISELTLPIQIIDPILYLLKISRNESVLLVIGGYTEKNNKMCPVQKIYVFYLRLDGGYVSNTAPLFQIKMRYPRIIPLVCKQKCADQKYLLIIGGNNTKKIKKEHFSDPKEEYENFKHSLKMGESILITTIKDTIFKAQMRAIKEINMENSLKIESSSKNLKKMYTFSEAGVIRIKTGKVQEKEGKTNFFIGVGLSKRSIYFIDYLDYLHSCLYISKAFTKFVASGVTSSEMTFFMNKNLYYLTEDNNEKNYKKQIIDFGEENQHKTTKCLIF